MRILLALVLALQAATPAKAQEPILVDELSSLGRTFYFHHYGEFVALAIREGEAREVFLLTLQEAALFGGYLDRAARVAPGLAPGTNQEMGTLKDPTNHLSVLAVKATGGRPYVFVGIYNTKTRTMASFPVFQDGMERFRESLANTATLVERNLGEGTRSGKQAGRLEVRFQYAHGGELRALAPEGHPLTFVYLPSLRALDPSGRQHELETLPRGARIEVEYTEQEAGRKLLKALRLKE